MSALPIEAAPLDDVLTLWAAALARSTVRCPKRALAVIELHIDEEAPVTIRINDGILSTLRSGHPMPTSILVGTCEALQRVLVGGQDITHQIASGGLRLLAGRYDDVILLSRILRHVDWDGEVRP